MQLTNESKIRVEKLGVILRKTNQRFEHAGVLNPAVIQEGNIIKMLYRAFRDGNHSTFGYCEFEGPTTLVKRIEYPVVFPEEAFESQGVEDPRVVKIEGTYYVSYTAYDGKNAVGCIAKTTDFKTYLRLGIVTPTNSLKIFSLALDNNNHLLPKYREHIQEYRNLGLIENPDYKIWDKDLVLFPEKINGDFVMLHRIMPGIQIARFKEFKELNKQYWKEHLFNLHKYIVLDPLFDFENSHIGAGAPPIKTEKGWLLINHGVEYIPGGRRYHATAAMLDLNDPSKVIGRLPYPLFSPDENYEKTGYVNNVCFPTGTAIFGDDLYIFYGAADNTIALAKVNLSELIESTLKYLPNESN